MASSVRAIAATACLLLTLAVALASNSSGDSDADGGGAGSSALDYPAAASGDALTGGGGAQPSASNVAEDIWNEEDDDGAASLANPLSYGPTLRRLSVLVKRAPNGFIGMRGKKEEHDDVADADGWNGPALRSKKAPTAFYGVRGKKYGGGGRERFNSILRRWEADERREELLQDLLDRLDSAAATENEIVDKRAPTGFMGMRGKKAIIAASSNDHQSFRRSPSEAYMGGGGPSGNSGGGGGGGGGFSLRSGGKQQRFVDFGNKFVAVRGKKRTTTTSMPGSAAFLDDDDSSSGAGLRSSLSGDYGRRHLAPSFYYYGTSGKRAPSGFLGMRGKRAPLLGFFGLKGSYAASTAPPSTAEQLAASNE